MRLVVATVDWPPIEGGISTLAVGLSKALAGLGHEVSVVLPALPGAREAARDCGVDAWPSPGYALGPPRLLPLLATTRRCLRATRAELLLALNPGYGGLAGAWLASPAGIDYAVYAYGFDFLKYRHRPLVRRLLRQVYTRAHRVLAISEYTRGALLEQGLAARSVVVLPPGVDAPDSAAAPPQRLAGRPYVLSVGRLIPRKGLLTLAGALLPLLEQRPDWHWVVVGRGPEQRRLAALCAASPAHERVHLLGHLDPPRLAGCYRHAQFFALTPRELPGDVEGYGIVYLEAGLHGLPALATRTGGVPEAVLDGRTGLLTAPGDSQALEPALTRLLDDPGLRRTLGAAARTRAQSQSWRWHASQLLGSL